MKPLKDKSPWPLFAVFDIESTEWVNLRCLCHVDEFGNRKHFTEIRKYVDWLYGPSFLGDSVWAHWGGKFDMRFILPEAHRRGWSIETILSGNLTVIMAVTDANKRTIRFCESARIMPDSVEAVGKSVKLPKLDADRKNIDDVPWDELLTYCFRDCDIVLKGLQQMREVMEAQGVDFAYTLASMTTRYIRRSDVIDWRKLYEADPERPGKLRPSREFGVADAFSANALFGGRTEMFKMGKFNGPLYYYDVTSSYPWSMTHELPAYFKGFFPPMSNTTRTLQRCGVSVAKVWIPAGTMKYPLLPYKHQNKVMFYAGYMNAVWTNIELAALWEHMRDVPGFRLEIQAQAVYEPLAFMRPFVQQFWTLREKAIAEKDEFKKYAYKIAMNSAYGKLGEQIYKTKILTGKHATRAMKEFGMLEEVTRNVRTAGLNLVQPTPVPGVYILRHEAEGAFRHAAAAAYITARSRLKLWEAFIRAESMGAQVYYADTDSVIVDKPIFGNAEDKKLGEWHLECVIKRIEIWAPKVYMYESMDGKLTYRAKGMPIERRENKGDPAKTHELWRQFTAMRQGIELPKPEKDGLSGLLTDIHHGTLGPTVFVLKRSVQTIDSKRQHADGDSDPVYFEQEGTPDYGVNISGARRFKEVS